MATLQTGTAPNQIPTNGDLGDLAFQSKESVQFTGGRGALSSINLNQIYKEIAVTAVDVFVYDTSKDSDGGAWRSRTQHTSWYNETLNTATRGSRREFPSVAVIVATSNAITIYDGDDSDMPMWMVFNQGSGKCLYTNGFSLTAVTALNGILSWAGFRLGVIRFLSDSFSNYEQSFYNYSIKPLSERNGTGTAAYTTSPVILNLYTNDVAMTVLPTAPIDAATGLPIPTIAVATNGGVSIIKHDGTVINLLTTSGTQNSISFTASKGLETHGGGGVAYFGWGWYSVPQASTNTSDYLISNNAWSTTNIRRQGSGGNSALYPMTTTNYGIVIRETAGVSTTDKLILIALTNPAGYSLQSYLTTKYNTGWMPGDISGAWLSDTTQETVVGSELVTNGTFDSNVSGWTQEPGTSGTITYQSGVARVTRGGGSGPSFYQAISTQVGKSYVVSATLNGVQTRIDISARTNVFGSGGTTINRAVGTSGQIVYGIFTFVAVGTTTYLYMDVDNNGAYGEYDNITCRLADPDRSVNAKGLQVFGSITKSAVATGADLVGYSFPTTSGYFEQPYNSAIGGVGTGDFCVMGWFRNSPSATTWFDIASDASPRFFVAPMYGATDNVWIYMNTAAGTFNWNPSPAFPVVGKDYWQFIAVKRSGITISVSLNGSAWSGNTTITAGGSLNSTSRVTIGQNYTHGAAAHTGQMALWRFSQTAPSAEQIAKIYEDEKYLFQDNAKATLYGTSDVVTALAYDEDTQLLHAGTSSGRSVFRGLRRVDNTTTAVGAAISAANGLVAED